MYEQSDYRNLNTTELLDILSRAPYGHVRLRFGLPRERLIHLIEHHEIPAPHELAGTMETRKSLEKWISRTPGVIQHTPCAGVNKAKCTVYPCSETIHIDCYLSARGLML